VDSLALEAVPVFDFSSSFGAADCFEDGAFFFVVFLEAAFFVVAFFFVVFFAAAFFGAFFAAFFVVFLAAFFFTVFFAAAFFVVFLAVFFAVFLAVDFLATFFLVVALLEVFLDAALEVFFVDFLAVFLDVFFAVFFANVHRPLIHQILCINTWDGLVARVGAERVVVKIDQFTHKQKANKIGVNSQ